jgi:hypothetical protein
MFGPRKIWQPWCENALQPFFFIFVPEKKNEKKIWQTVNYERWLGRLFQKYIVGS